MLFKLKLTHYLLVFCLFFSCCMVTSAAWSDTTAVEREADKIFKQMSDYLAEIDQFTVSSQSSLETMLDSGQKIMLDYANVTSVQRPDKMFNTRKGFKVEQSLYYDGKSFTNYDHSRNQYAVISTSGTLSESLDLAVNKFELTAPGADLLFPNSYERLSRGLLDGFYVGKTMIDAVECHHLAFRNGDVDWQIWIQAGDKPLPVKYVITSRWITGAPQYSISMKWNVKPGFSDKIFQFIPPENAVQVDSINKS